MSATIQPMGFEWCLPPSDFRNPDSAVAVESRIGTLVLTRVERVSDGYGTEYIKRTMLRYDDLNTADE